MTIPNIVEIFLIAGQSNASGTGTGFPKRQALWTPEGIIYSSLTPHATIFPPPNGGQLNRLCALSNTEGALNNRGHGIELNLAYQYNAYFGKPCIILKESAGATSLQGDWGVGSTLRNRLISRTNTLTSMLTSMGKSWTISMFYWDQWEGDASDFPPGNVNYYGTLFSGLTTDLKANINGFTDSTLTIGNRPSVKNTFSGTQTNRRAAIQAGAGIVNYAFIDQDDLIYIEPEATPVHCDTDSQNLKAQRALTAKYPGITFI